MANNNKFGTFSGVFTPSILTILGVILYMRMGWVVGNAGLIGALIIVLIAHIISISTGLSVSSISTDKKVGAGGIYYILSRSLGIPIGGAIGLALYVGTAFSISLYLIGFAESFNGYLGFDTNINGLRLTGSIALIILTIIALISTSVALKTQFFIFAAIVISLISIYLGTWEFAPQTVTTFSGAESAPLEVVFAIFFPAVTGFTAGIAMSGNLQDPKKSIPIGTISAIGAGFLVYVSMAVFLAYAVNSELLRTDYNILMKIAFFAPAVIAGIWGATLSSALGGILGGPRILQAMSNDRVTPQIFGKGRGEENEPINALFLVFVIAQTGILIGELDVIARVVSMFYLAAYGFINISFFLESWANPDFQPSFKVNRWIGLIGFIACFGVMFKLDMIAMLASIIIIIGIHFWLQRKQIELDTGNVWQSVWGKIVAKGLNKLDVKESKDGKWNPNIILFSGESQHRPHLLEFSRAVSGQNGIVTNFNLVKKNENNTPLTKTSQIIKNEKFEELGIFGRKMEVDNIYQGIENVATTFGFSGLDPNTIMMGWTKNHETQYEFSNLTQNLIHLDYNILFLEFNQLREFGNKQTIDIWWRKTDSNNAEMMLSIARFLKQSPNWSNANIRVLFVNNSDTDNSLIHSEISKLNEKLRINTEIKVISNNAERKSLYKIIELESSDTDLVIIGIPDKEIERKVKFVNQTNKLFKFIGSTLLVKASNQFNEIDLSFAENESLNTNERLKIEPLPKSEVEIINELVKEFDYYLSSTANNLSKPALSSITSAYCQFIENIEREFEVAFSSIINGDASQTIISDFKNNLDKVISISNQLKSNRLDSLKELLDKELKELIGFRKKFLETATKKVKIATSKNYPKKRFSGNSIIYWKKTLNYLYYDQIFPHFQKSVFDFGKRNSELVISLYENIDKETKVLIENLLSEKNDSIETYRENLSKRFADLKNESQKLQKHTITSIKVFERKICIDLIEQLEDLEFTRNIHFLNKGLNKKEIKEIETKLSQFPLNWLNNQKSVHRSIETGLELLTTGIQISQIDGRIKRHVNKMILSSQKNKLRFLEKALSYAKEGSSNDSQFNKRKLDKLADGINYINFGNSLAAQETAILAISNSNHEFIDLIRTDSDMHEKESEKVSINMALVKSYIVQNHYLTPLQKIKDSLSKTNNEISEEIYYSANLLNHVIEHQETEEEINSQQILDEVQIKIESSQAKLSNLYESFKYDSTINLNNTLSNLNIKAILNSSDTYEKVSKTPLLKPKIQDWFGEKKTDATGAYEAITGFIVQRKQEIDSRKFEIKDKQFLNNIELTNNFVKSISLKANVAEELPFYLQKLSAAGSFEKSKITENDENLLSAKNAIENINSGISGAIMILGETLSGKSHFTERIAKTFQKGEIIKLIPPAKQNFGENDLHIAFQNSFNKTGTAKSILEQTNKRLVLIFDDIEKWWTKSLDGNKTINFLAKLIEDYGNRHYFLINSNIHSFQVLKQSTNLEQQLLATIILSPATKSELKKVIIDRYNIAGVKLWFNDKPLNEARKIESLFSEIYDKSKGKIGLALNIWGSNIEKQDDGKLTIKSPAKLKFPDISNPYWKIILYHLLIHHRLTEVQLNKLFKKSDKKWVLDVLRQMEKAELVHKQINNSYELNSIAKHYVEDWLKKLRVLKLLNS